MITLHVPLLDSTKHMIGEKQFEEMKDHVIIVNTARGGLIDDEALAKALVNGKACLQLDLTVWRMKTFRRIR